MKLVTGLAAAAALVFFGCSGEKGHDSHGHEGHDHAHDKSKHAHHHNAPHDGTLVVLGEEFAHLEFVLDAQTGKLTAYGLDGEAEKALRMGQPMIELAIEVQESSFSLELKPVSNALTGESEQETSEFSGQSDQLKGASKFSALIKSVEIKGQKFDSVKFPFPEGNE